MSSQWAICSATDDGVVERFGDVRVAAEALSNDYGTSTVPGGHYLRWVPEPTAPDAAALTELVSSPLSDALIADRLVSCVNCGFKNPPRTEACHCCAGCSHDPAALTDEELRQRYNAADKPNAYGEELLSRINARDRAEFGMSADNERLR